MSNAGTPNGKGAGWSDRELLAYLFSLVEFSNVKLDSKNAPRPAGRTVRGCEQKIQGLKKFLAAELDAIRSCGAVVPSDPTPKKTAAGRKRKTVNDEECSGTPTPAKRSRKKANDVDVEPEVGDDSEMLMNMKAEVKDDEEGECEEL